MKKEKLLLKLKIYDGERQYTDYTIIDKKQKSTLTDKQIIAKFFFDNKVDDDQCLSDGRAVRIEGAIKINESDVKRLEKLSMAFYDNFKKELAQNGNGST